MALVLNEEQSMLRDSARGLISDKAPVSHLRQLRDAKDATGFSRDLWRAFAEMGFSGLLVPENFGGSGRGAVASEMVGVSEEVFGRTVSYLKERKQFGRLIGEFQALQHRAAQVYIDIEITRAAVLKALQTLDGDFANAGAAIAVAKARAGTTATLAVQEGVQMHGGMGMTDQFDIGFFMKRARVCQELFGDSNFHADQLARMKSY